MDQAGVTAGLAEGLGTGQGVGSWFGQSIGCEQRGERSLEKECEAGTRKCLDLYLEGSRRVFEEGVIPTRFQQHKASSSEAQER